MRFGVGMAVCIGRVAAVTPPFDPATVGLTSWVRAGTGWTDGGGGSAGVWTGVASAGASGSRSFDHQGTGLPTPATGAALNSLTGPDFNGVDDILYASPLALSNYVGTGAAFVSALINADTAAADPGAGSRRDAPAIIGEANGYMGLHYHAGGVTFAVVTDAAGGTLYEVTKACSTGTWHEVVAWWDGTNLHLEVDGVAAALVPTTGTDIANKAGNLLLGKNYASAYFDGRVYDLATAASAVMTSAQYASYLDNRYGLTL